MTDPLIEILRRFTNRARERGIPYHEALTDAMETWLEMDDAYQEYSETDEGKHQCMPAINIDDLPPPIAERLRAALRKDHLPADTIEVE